MSLGDLSGSHTFESFLDLLKVHHRDTGEEIRILAYVSDLEAKDLFNYMNRYPSFSIRQLGEIIQVRIQSGSDKDEPTEEWPEAKGYQDSLYFCHYNTTKNLLLCFTTETLEMAGRTMDRFANHTSGIFPLWIHPMTLNAVRRQILADNPDSIISEFHARRFRVGDDQEVLRGEHIGRYFKYMADDGNFTLDEITKVYGVLPTSIVFNVLNICKFRINHQGKFAFIYGNIDFLFTIINDLLARVLVTKKVVDRAKTEFIPIDMGKKQVKLAKVVPLDIVFSREVDFTEMEDFLGSMSKDDFNFEILDSSMIPGSIHLSGTIVDHNKHSTFDITGNSEKITLSPGVHTSFDSMLQFYKLITEWLDVEARVQTPQIVHQKLR
ncbi:MAG: hypothetical protein ACREBU_02520 [Nitrososphaera sp.]